MPEPTPSRNARLPFRTEGFATLTEGLDYAARGETGFNFHGGRGALERVLPYAELADAAKALAPRLFAVENLYQTMHPRLARATTRLFCRLMLQAEPPRQSLLTTHNPLVLDGLDLRDDRIRLFAVERSSRGPTQVYRVQVSDEVLQATESGLSLSNLWVMGRLGGVPDIF